MTAVPSAPSAGNERFRVGPPPPFDPELAAALEAVAEEMPPALHPEMIPALRESMAAFEGADPDLTGDGAFEVEDRTVPGPRGAPDVSLLVCRPTGTDAAVPVIYHTHGGGMVVGDSRSGILEILDWARELGAGVVSVEYRLAPENPHPAPVEDCYAGLVWTAGHAAELGFDPARIIVAAWQRRRRPDRGRRPARPGPRRPCAAGAGTALPDARRPQRHPVQPPDGRSGRVGPHGEQHRMDGPPRRRARRPGRLPYAAPARAEDLTGLPPAFIDVGSAETFRDEAVAYATRMWQAGGRAELHVWPGGFHGYDQMAPEAALSQDTKAARLRWLRRLLGQ